MSLHIHRVREITFEKIRLLKHKFDSMTDELGKIYADISVEAAEDEIKEILEEAKENKEFTRLA